jgi:hypothetical protein
MMCKKESIATRTTAAGPATQIPYEEPEETPAQVTDVKARNRRSLADLKRSQ